VDKLSDYYKLVIMGRPLPKSNMYGIRAWIEGKRAKAIIYTTKELEDYELMIGEIAGIAIPEVLVGYYSLYVRIYQKGLRFIDIDNSLKGIQDSLDSTKYITRNKVNIKICPTGILDDKYFQLIVGERFIFENKSEEEERIEIIIAPYRGIFGLAETIREEYGIEDDYYQSLFMPPIKERKEE
jgi:hypothetical protein